LSVPIAVIALLLAPKNRNNSSPEAIPMNPSAAQNAVRQGKQNATEIALSTIHRGVKLTRWYALTAARKLLYRSNLVRAGRSIVVIATVK
jgi:hypothetical protein